jgi:hypothetical protein
MPLTIDLSAREAGLMRLAVLRMLGDPRWGSERASQGRRSELQAVYEQTQNSDAGEALALQVEPQTVELLDSALRRLTSELKNYDLLSAAGGGERDASMVAGFDEELSRLFPEAVADRAEMDRLVPEVIALRRDFSRTRESLVELAETTEREAGKVRPWWQFWRGRAPS